MHPFRRRTGKVAAAIAALALVAAACGDDASTTGAGGGADVALPDCLGFADLYALVGPESQGFTAWSDANDLAAEVGAEHAPYPDAELVITGPGEESGTFDTFVELVIEPIAEERGEDATTRPDYTSSPNDNVIIEGVASSPGSLGWVGYAFYIENQQQVEVFGVDRGEGCVAPTDESIADGTYGLSRPLFIYVNDEEAAGNPAVEAYVDFYLSDEGLASVSEAGYVQLTDGEWNETIETWEGASALGGGPSEVLGRQGGALSGEVDVSGSSTVQPISGLIAEKFSADHPDVAISVDGPGTGDGFQLFCNGDTDISDASRPIEDAERRQCETNGVEFTELKIGIDGLTVMTSP